MTKQTPSHRAPAVVPTPAVTTHTEIPPAKVTPAADQPKKEA